MEVAKYIINKCTLDNYPISNLKLLKILYYIQIAFLQKFGEPCFEDDIQARKFGPVVPQVYRHYRKYSSLPIDIQYSDKDLPKFKETQKKLIDSIIEDKREKYVWDLVTETHEKGSAWHTIYREGEGNYAIIPLQILKEYGRYNNKNETKNS